MLAHAFVRHAFLAGTMVALACGVVGWFLVLRAQVFAGDALSHVAFTGALAAAAAGVDVRAGLYVATVAVALAMAGLGRRARADDETIGAVFVWVLGLGALFLALFVAHASVGNGVAGVRVLFGSIYGLSTGAAWLAAIVAAAVCAATVAIGRPLLLASIDADVAAARGVPVRLLGLLFLVLVGVGTAQATQALGALLVLGLLATPAGAAHRVCARPYVGLVLAAGFAVAAVWIGLTAAYVVPSLPPSFAIVAAATAIYVAAAAIDRLRQQ
jgi:zinc/manganese transport system permease protein